MTTTTIPRYNPECARCTVGRASGVGRGGTCPMIDRHRSSGSWIYLEGEPADAIHYVKRGTVVLHRAPDDASDGVAWAVRREGSILGAEALVRATYLDSARALDDAVVCAASRDDVRAWMQARPAGASALLECVLRAQSADTPRAAAPDGSAVQRVARWLLDQPARPGAPLPRGVVAELLGMEPETLSRALSRLGSAGAIHATRKSIEVLDADELRALADARASRHEAR